ncbi:MAG: hypothetical protein ABUL64_03380, partial [Singulisphaera sp.]
MSKQPKDVLQITGDLANKKVGAILRRWQTDKSWSQIHALLRGRRILLDGNLVQDPAKTLVAGQVLKLLPQPIAAPATERDVRIQYRDADVVVVEKPAGITSIRHPEEERWPARRRQLQPTLTELLPRLLARIERQQKQGRPGGCAVRAV